MYPKSKSLKRAPRNECSRRGCHVRVKKGVKYCALHSVAKKRKKTKTRSIRPEKKIEFKKAKAAFQLFIRLRDSNDIGKVKCCSCQKSYRWNRVDAGHYYPAKNRNTCFEENNVHGQCKACNMSMDDPLTLNGYTNFLIEKIGKDALQMMGYRSKKTSRFDAWAYRAIRHDSLYRAEKLHLQKFGSELEHHLLKAKDYKLYKENLK